MADFESTRTWTWSEYLSSIFQSVYPWLAIHCLLRSPETVPLVSKHYFSSFTRNLLKSFSVFLRLDCFRTARLISTHHGMAFSLVSEQHLSEHLLESPLGWNSWKLTKKKRTRKIWIKFLHRRLGVSPESADRCDAFWPQRHQHNGGLPSLLFHFVSNFFAPLFSFACVCVLCPSLWWESCLDTGPGRINKKVGNRKRKRAKMVEMMKENHCWCWSILYEPFQVRRF